MSETVTEYLAYHFTDAEKLDLLKQIARTQSEKHSFENQKAQVTKQLAGEIAARDTELQKLAEFAGNGYEYRMIECTVMLDDPKRGMASIYRKDTGELVRGRLMTAEEMQMPLPGMVS